MKFTKNPKNLIYGRHPILEALDGGQAFDKIFIQSPAKTGPLKEIKQRAGEMGITTQMVPYEKLKRLTNATHQGVAGYLSLIQYYRVEDILSQAYETGEMPLFVILDGIQDVRNFGAIVRSANCFGAHAIIIARQGSAPVSADAIKASAGALTSFPICREDNLEDTINYLKDNGLTIAVTTITESNSINKTDFNRPLAIVMGSEESGVSHNLLRKADFEIHIKHHKNFNSLNVSVASGIIFYEILRQRQLAIDNK